LELSKKSWLLAIQFPDQEQPSLYSIEGGDAERLIVKLTAARDRWAKVSDPLPIVTLCYELRYDAFWLVVAKLRARHRSTNSRCLPAPMAGHYVWWRGAARLGSDQHRAARS
jgi:hypothetical protein